MSNVCTCKKCKDNAANKMVTREGGRHDGDPRVAAYRRCDGCKRPIPHYKDMGGAGFESPADDHIFDSTVTGKVTKQAVHLEVCYDCFKSEWAKKYGDDEPCPRMANVDLVTPI